MTNLENKQKKVPELAFARGMREIKAGDVVAVKSEICNALNIIARQTFQRRRDGYIAHTLIEAVAIENIFRKYGVKKCWGK